MLLKCLNMSGLHTVLLSEYTVSLHRWLNWRLAVCVTGCWGSEGGRGRSDHAVGEREPWRQQQKLPLQTSCKSFKPQSLLVSNQHITTVCYALCFLVLSQIEIDWKLFYWKYLFKVQRWNPFEYTFLCVSIYFPSLLSPLISTTFMPSLRKVTALFSIFPFSKLKPPTLFASSSSVSMTIHWRAHFLLKEMLEDVARDKMMLLDIR